MILFFGRVNNRCSKCFVASGLRAPRGSAKERDHKKFLLYSLYAWGVPAIILAISLVMDLVPFIPDSFIKPGFGIKKCWFYGKHMCSVDYSVVAFLRAGLNGSLLAYSAGCILLWLASGGETWALTKNIEELPSTQLMLPC